VRPGRAERDPEPLREGVKLLAPLADTRRALVEGVAAARADLDLRGDQLAHEVVFQLGAPGRGLEVLEPVDERQRLGVEDRELLLDGHGEVARRLELLVREPDLLVRRKPLGVSHRRSTLVHVTRTSPWRRAWLASTQELSPSGAAARNREISGGQVRWK
jgi:hypothetical protein